MCSLWSQYFIILLLYHIQNTLIDHLNISSDSTLLHLAINTSEMIYLYCCRLGMRFHCSSVSELLVYGLLGHCGLVFSFCWSAMCLVSGINFILTLKIRIMKTLNLLRLFPHCLKIEIYNFCVVCSLCSFLKGTLIHLFLSHTHASNYSHMPYCAFCLF